MRIFEITSTPNTIKPIKPLTPDQARISNLKKQKDNANKALKAERNKQAIHKAQSNLYIATQKSTV
jgi:hypothetical protein